jgi:glycosyltransferase involved in cell wall biosynthesis
VAELISVIVTTYNREDALDAVLRSLAQQNDAAFEVIVADDGSGPATAALVHSWQPRFGRRLEHVWHDDDGFRAAEIRNRAVLASRGGYVVFLDGDCIARRDFVATHRRIASPGWFVAGNRVLLSPQLTRQVLDEKLTPENWSAGTWIAQRLRGGINRLSALVQMPLGPLRRLRPAMWKGARSCNLAVWRADLDRVDGFDAAYRGWGKEDSDILVRLLHAGVRRKDGSFATGVLHLWHAEADRAHVPQNERMLGDILGADRIRASRGLSALAGVSGASGAANRTASRAER